MSSYSFYDQGSQFQCLFLQPELIKISYNIRRQFGMSRNNVFKLSGNMALGSNEAYSNSDFDSIKNSLKLLKSKQAKQSSIPEPTNYYGGSYSSNVPTRQQPTSKNIPSNEYQNAYNYQNPRSSNQNSAYNDPYYQMQQHIPKNDYKSSRNNQHYEQAYQDRNEYQKPSQKAQSNQRAPPQKQVRQQQRRGSQFQERNIKEINRQNRVEIKEYDPSELVECGEGCGRKFNPDSISKHQAVCRQVFQKKRKQFNAQDQRLVANQQKKLMKRGEIIQKKIEEKKAREKIPKWKAQSLQFRAGLKQARGGDYQPTKEERQIMQEAHKSQFTKCQFCGRNFNEEAAKKHIPFCESQQKKNVMRRK